MKRELSKAQKNLSQNKDLMKLSFMGQDFRKKSANSLEKKIEDIDITNSKLYLNQRRNKSFISNQLNNQSINPEILNIMEDQVFPLGKNSLENYSDKKLTLFKSVARVENLERKLYKLKNVFDSCEEKEIELDEEPLFLIEIEGNFKKIWEVFMLGTIIYSAFITPINLCFLIDNPTYRSIEIIIEISLIFDIILSFFTQIEDVKENIISSSKVITKTYLQSWFFLDTITCFPVSLLGSIVEENIYLIYLKWFALVRLLKLIKYPFLTNKTLLKNHQLDRLIKQVSFFIIMVHILSCFFIFIGIENINTLNWITSAKILDKYIDIYLSSLYYHLLLISTIGFGGVEPVTIFEKNYTNVILIIISLIFPFILISISKLYVGENTNEIKLISKINILNKVNKKYCINKELRKNIKNELKTENEKLYLERLNFYDDLPHSIKIQLNGFIFKKSLKKNLFFNSQSYDFIIFVIPFLRFSKPKKGELLYSVGEKVDNMYIVNNGLLSLNLGLDFCDLEIANIRPFNYFGDIFLLTNKNSPFNLAPKSSKTEVYSIQSIDFNQIKINFPKHILQISENSAKSLDFINKRKTNLIDLYEKEKSKEKVMKIINEVNTYLFERDFDEYYFNNKEIEGVNDFLLKNNLTNVKEVIEVEKKKKKLIRSGSYDNKKIYYSKMIDGLKKTSETTLTTVTPRKKFNSVSFNTSNKKEFLASIRNSVAPFLPRKKTKSKQENSSPQKILAEIELKVKNLDLNKEIVNFKTKNRNFKKERKKAYFELLRNIYKINFEQDLCFNSEDKLKAMKIKISHLVNINKKLNLIDESMRKIELKSVLAQSKLDVCHEINFSIISKSKKQLKTTNFFSIAHNNSINNHPNVQFKIQNKIAIEKNKISTEKNISRKLRSETNINAIGFENLEGKINNLFQKIMGLNKKN